MAYYVTNLTTVSQPMFLFKWKHMKNSDEALTVVPVCAMKARGGSRGIFLTSVLDGDVWLASCLCTFNPKKEHRCPLNRRLGGFQSWSRHFREEKNLMPLLGFKLQIDHPV